MINHKYVLYCAMAVTFRNKCMVNKSNNTGKEYGTELPDSARMVKSEAGNGDDKK